jgi:peptidoglycan-associated lipoprotein
MARKTVLFIAVATIALAGCAKKRPEVLPPAPTQDNQPAQPQQQPRGSGILPGSADDFVRSISSDTIHFGFDNYDIDPEAQRILDSQAAWLIRFPNVHVTIEGHCDERGTREYNLALGDRRANSAKNYLAGKGVAAVRITTISYGKERPIAQGSDEASWAQNRRAVTVVIQ